jgi:hypothetical protein
MTGARVPAAAGIFSSQPLSHRSGPTQPPIQWVPGALPRGEGGKVAGM